MMPLQLQRCLQSRPAKKAKHKDIGPAGHEVCMSKVCLHAAPGSAGLAAHVLAAGRGLIRHRPFPAAERACMQPQAAHASRRTHWLLGAARLGTNLSLRRSAPACSPRRRTPRGARTGCWARPDQAQTLPSGGARLHAAPGGARLAAHVLVAGRGQIRWQRARALAVAARGQQQLNASRVGRGTAASKQLQGAHQALQHLCMHALVGINGARHDAVAAMRCGELSGTRLPASSFNWACSTCSQFEQHTLTQVR